MATRAESQQASKANSTAAKTDGSFKFRKVASLPTKNNDDFKYAAIAVSFDQKAVVSRNYLVSTGEDVYDRIGAYLWSLDPHEPKRTKLPDSTTFGFVPNSTLAYQVHWNRGVQFRDTRTHEVSGEYVPHKLREDTTMGPAVSPSGEVMVTRSQLDHVQFWDIEKRKPITEEIKQAGIVYRLEFSTDGKRFFSMANRSLSIWEAENGTLVAGPLKNDISSSAHSSITGQLATFENNDRNEDDWRCELVLRSGKTFTETERVRLPAHARQAIWIDDAHLLVVADVKTPGQRRPYTYGRKLVFLVSLASDKPKVRTVTRHTWIKGIAVAPDRQHFIVRTRDATSCWKVGEERPAWTKPGDYLASFGDKGLVLLHNGPLIAYSVASGTKLWCHEDVDKFRVKGSNIWICNESQMEVWRVERDE